ncbi:MAG: riboflavin biosynthesis protein RibF [candidate division Zixibacteria bacterium]|nr:riboflavin biosynthesis protein RibF [candidate division Zixibacteria bacterium]
MSQTFAGIPQPRPIVRLDTESGVAKHVSTPTVVCVGTFDGVHLGHQMIVRRGRALADERGWPLWVLTFHPHPKTVVQPARAPLLLTDPEERVALFSAYGADGAVILHFDAATARTGAQEFAESMLGGQMQAGAVVVGEDFAFGRAREGTAQFLAEWGQRTARKVEIVPLVKNGDDEAIRSSVIRNCLSHGDFGRAIRLMGHPYLFTGRVVKGDGRGKELGYPTWNLAPSEVKLSPEAGVYIGWTWRPRPMPAMAYYGSNPTFGEHPSRLEVHVLDGEEEDRTPQGPVEGIWLTEFVRPEKRFGGADELVRQMVDDEQVARLKLNLKPTIQTTTTHLKTERRKPASAG